ncbi:hypothetical protein NUSPORA_00992 [Nucleospora cyclopteri]
MSIKESIKKIEGYKINSRYKAAETNSETSLKPCTIRFSILHSIYEYFKESLKKYGR